MEKKLFLLDAYALIYRAYYAMMRSPRVTSKGFNTSAIFGFCNTLDDVLRKEAPTHIAVCFDPVGGHTFRHDAYPEYKAQRDKQPEDITNSIPYIKDILSAMNIPVIERPGFEADDVVGTLARRAEAEGFTTYMMTPDKDYGQLVTDNIYMYRPALGGKGFEIRGPQQVCERYGIESPAQVIDLLALEGDASDNVPGCPGVGEKTAAKLIAQWGSVEGLLANVDQLKGALRTKVETNAEQIRFSKFLVTIKTNVPLDIAPDDLIRKEPDTARLAAIYSELEFRTMAAKLPQHSQPSEISENSEYSEPSDHSDFKKPAVEVLDTPAAAADFVASLTGCTSAAVAIDAPGDEAMTASLQGLAVAAESRVVYFPMPAFEHERRELLAALAPLFASQTLTIACHDVKRAIVVLRCHGVDWTAPYYDTTVAHYLLAPEMTHDLSVLAYGMLAYRTDDYELSAVERKKRIFTDVDQAAAHLGERAAVVAALVPLLQKQLAEAELTTLYDTIEAPLIPVLARMELTGVRIDPAVLAEQSRRLSERLAALEAEAYELAGTPFNVNSPAQVGQVLFERLKIDPDAKRTKRGAWSTTEEVLEKYARTQPVVRLILDIRGLRKLLATYVDALPALINKITGRIHTTFNQTVTATGRLSSTNPNLQNIPVRTDDGREIRRAFVADEGNIILSADYSQIELRLIADISGDPEMIAAFNAGHDIHRATAARIFHESLDEVTDAQRRAAKTANFGIIYGISAFGLAERLGIPRGEAKSLIENYMATYPRIKQYMDEVIERARRDGYVTTIHGRKRFLPDITSRNAALRGYAERNAINAPLQGSAADIIKIAMIAVDRRMREEGLQSRMLMQVHDELIFDVVPSELDRLRSIVVTEMEAAYSGRVTLEVSCGTGHNWLEAH